MKFPQRIPFNANRSFVKLDFITGPPKKESNGIEFSIYFSQILRLRCTSDDRFRRSSLWWVLSDKLLKCGVLSCFTLARITLVSLSPVIGKWWALVSFSSLIRSPWLLVHIPTAIIHNILSSSQNRHNLLSSIVLFKFSLFVRIHIFFARHFPSHGWAFFHCVSWVNTNVNDRGVTCELAGSERWSSVHNPRDILALVLSRDHSFEYWQTTSCRRSRAPGSQCRLRLRWPAPLFSEEQDPGDQHFGNPVFYRNNSISEWL